jgi:hypothetical protein
LVEPKVDVMVAWLVENVAVLKVCARAVQKVELMVLKAVEKSVI